MPPRELTDDYRLEKILSSSRGGSILRASRIDTGQTVVIKLINVPAADPALAPKIAARFRAYATGLAGLRHPNLPLVMDSGLTPDGGAFLVMEKLDGIGFEADLAPSGAGASPDRILPLLAQALAGLEELARHGLAHLNLCPENLLLVPAGPATPVALPAIGGPAAPAQTVKLLGLGTPLFHLGEPWPEAPSARFRAPELSMPSAAQETMPDWHADCYALALTACYALGATVAFGEVAGTMVHSVQMPLALSFELANDEALRQILERCLRQSPGERPAHGEIRDAFRQALGGIELPGGGAATPDHRAVSPERHRESTSRPLAAVGAGIPEEDRGPRDSGGIGAAGDPRDDWRSLLGESPPPEQPRGWAAPGPADAFSEAGRAAGAATAESSAPMAAGAGGDSFFDLFDVPATLPPLPPLSETAEPAAPNPFGFQFPDVLELPQVDDLFASGAHGPAARESWGLAASAAPLPAPLRTGDDRSPQAAAAVEASRPAGIAAIPDAEGLAAEGTAAGRTVAEGAATEGTTTEATAAERVATEGTAAERAAGVPGPAGILAAPWTAGTAPSAPGTSVAVPPPPEVAAPRADPAQGELLSGVDELLGTLPPLAPPAPLMPPPAPSRGARGGSGGGGRAGRAAGTIASRGAPAPAAALRPGTAAAAAGRKLLAPLLALPRPVLLAGAGALLLAAGVAAWALIAHASRQAQSAARVVVAAPAAPPLKPGRSAAAKLFDAKSYLIFGREADARVRQALRELTYADQGALGPAGCRQLAAIEQTLAASALETAPQDLASGLRAGDLGTLESVVAVASDRDLPPRQRGDLERARNLVNQYELARAVAAGGDQAQVLERFRAVEGLSRTWRDPLELRDHAVQALEAEARALAIDGRYEEALGRLGPILRNWPERAGIKDLAKRYETASASEPSQLALLESVPSYESRRKPSEALDLLRPLQPTPHLEQRFAEAKLRLEAQLAQLDAQPPEVALRPGYPLDYWRGTVVTLSFRVTDDYEVKSVKVFARPEAGRLTEMPLQRSGFGWDVKIPPSFHQNGTVELYVVATDLSGHEGYLGSRENPLHLKRRQGFQQLLH